MALRQTRRLASLFEATGHMIEERVGARGQVHFIATPKTGLVRPRTYFTTLDTRPADPAIELDLLHRRADELGVDRSLGVILAGDGPAEPSVGSTDRRATLLSYRDVLLELVGVPQRLREFIDNFNEMEPYPLRALRADGSEVDVYEAIATYLSTDATQPLLIEAVGFDWWPDEEVALYRQAQRFLAEPGRALPLYFLGWLLTEPEFEWRTDLPYPIFHELLRRGFLALLGTHDFTNRDPLPRPGHYVWLSDHDPRRAGPRHFHDRLRIVEPTPIQVGEWLATRLGDLERSALLRSALRHLPGLAEFVGQARRYQQALRTLRQIQTEPATEADLAIQLLEGCEIQASAVELDGALDDYLLGRPMSGAAVNSSLGIESLDPAARDAPCRFTNPLVRDYLLGLKLVHAASEGRADLLLRHSWPALTRAVLTRQGAPAGLEADHLERLRDQVARETERRLNLELAHMLKRPVSTIHTYFQQLRERMGQAERAAYARELQRIEEEILLLETLSERARRLGQEPVDEFSGVEIAEVVEQVGLPLRRRYPTVSFLNDIPAGLQVRVRADGLREALFHLMENAFHAAVFSSSCEARREVRLAVQLVGDTVRIDVRDSGEGIRLADRERIFGQYVSTKKGGDRPIGTGLGLTIAKRFTELMGGQIGLDASQPQTCFYLQFSRWEDL